MRVAARPAALCVEASDWVGTQPDAEHDRGLCATSNRLDPIKRSERKRLIIINKMEGQHYDCPSTKLGWVFSLHPDLSVRFNVSDPTFKSSFELFVLDACFLLAVSLDTLPSIISHRKFKVPTRTHRISLVWARCHSEHHMVLVINLPSRSTALTCCRTRSFNPLILYAIRASKSTAFRELIHFPYKFLHCHIQILPCLLGSDALSFA